MRAVRNTERGIEVVEVDELPGERPTVAVRSAAICGSDLHMLAYGPSPTTLGHEVAGVLTDGTPVAINPSGPCGECDQCVRGATHLCRTGSDRVVGISIDGGMADAVEVAASAAIRLPEGLRVEDACLVEPLGVAVHGMRIAGLTGGERVAVVGAGAIGLAAVAAAAPRASDVGLVARHAAQREAGERLGARDATGEYDVVIEAAGTESALEQAVDLCAPGAMIVFLSTHWSPVAIPGVAALMKELTFRWSYTYSESDGRSDLADAARLLAATPELAPTLITHRFPLEDAAEAFRVAADRSHGAIKVVLEP